MVVGKTIIVSYRVDKHKHWRKKKKYNNVSTLYNGNRYDSIFEAQVAEDLDWRLKAKDIKGWDRQVRISLDVNGTHITNYFIDFIVYNNDGSEELLEVKGFATPVWQMKWKLLEALLPELYPNATMRVVRK